jgi:hypothetical protein
VTTLVCLRCQKPLSRPRVRLRLTYCSGPCYAALYQSEAPKLTPEQIVQAIKAAHGGKR